MRLTYIIADLPIFSLSSPTHLYKVLAKLGVGVMTEEKLLNLDPKKYVVERANVESG